MEETTRIKKVYLKNTKEGNPILLSMATVIYITLLIWVIGLKYNSSWLPALGQELRRLTFIKRVNTKPFVVGFRGMTDFLANILIYIPMGILLQIYFPRKSWDRLNCLIVFLSSFAFELSQLFTGFGGCSVLDLVSNTIGGYIGILFYIYNNNRLTTKKLNIIYIVVIVIFFPISIYAIINTINHWYLYII